MIESLSEHLVHILHTKDGAEVAKQCVWYSTAKVRIYLFFKKKKSDNQQLILSNLKSNVKVFSKALRVFFLKLQPKSTAITF